jgi:pimeloyl-ACP methyl ester carboxylesterase
MIVAWHLVDAPRTERAFAAAVPLHGLDAWRVYFGLPLTGARLPEGGWPELRRRVFQDPVLEVYQHIAGGGADEFPAALAEVRARLGIDAGPIGVLGGSMGGMVAQLAAAEGGAEVRAAVLINPVVRLRATVDGLSAVHGVRYDWSAPAVAFADRADFRRRAGELTSVAVRYITGADDFPAAIVDPVRDVAAELRRLGGTVDWQTVPGMAHALAEEPGVDPAPQTPHAATVDRLATEWFTAHLIRSGSPAASD